MFKGKELVQYFDEELWKRHTTLVEPIVVYQELVHGLQVLQTSELVQRAPISTQSAVDKTLALLQTDKKVQPNYVGVQSVQTQVQNVVQ